MGRFELKDTFYKKAKLEGFRARSAYKLLEIQQKYRAIKQGDKVLDLGRLAAPVRPVQAEEKTPPVCLRSDRRGAHDPSLTRHVRGG